MARRSAALSKYHEKRNFERTDEPKGAVVPSASGGHSFVIQKHAARRLHYDFRLELNGVLKSWAVPKGPSLAPSEKRLAVEVENHPIDYRDFEGTIPKGQYGGGAVIVWDRGVWAPIGDPHAGLKKGHLAFELAGEKLQGQFTLVRMAGRSSDRDRESGKKRGKNNWLLLKRSDEYVRAGKEAEIVDRMPKSILSGRTISDIEKGAPPKKTKATKLPAFASVTPQLATLALDVPTGDYLYEVKYDGYRILGWLEGGKARLASRNGNEWTSRFPEIAKALGKVRAKTAIFDGEVAYLDEDGRTNFQDLQAAIGGKDASIDRGRLAYFVFDLLHCDGVDMRALPLTERKAKLRTILAGEDLPLRFGEHAAEDGERFFKEACKLGLEGIVAKDASAPYAEKRSRAFLKVKCSMRQEMAIIGFTSPKGGRTGLGAILLGVRERSRLRYAGRVGTGFTRASLNALAKALKPLVVDEPPVEKIPRSVAKDAQWVKPKLVCEVRFTEWTRGGIVRHPSFMGLRDDKSPREVRREKSKVIPDAPSSGTKLRITHPERVVDETSGVTKGDLVNYHIAVSEYLLPYAKERPLMVLRCPAGTGKHCFYQKHGGKGFSPHLGHTKIDKHDVVYLTTREELVELAQWNVIEIHGWGSRLPKWQNADQLTFDLDPDEALPFSRVIDAARMLRADLQSLGLTSFVKTTGGKGLHVVAPIVADHPWEFINAFTHAIATKVERRDPDHFVAKMSKAARKGKIFIDYLRNGKGATAVLPYSPRARAGATVAWPISWRDLTHVDPSDFTVASVPAKLARRRVDPWGEFWNSAGTIDEKTVKKLARP